jgi:hypothetical protein
MEENKILLNYTILMWYSELATTDVQRIFFITCNIHFSVVSKLMGHATTQEVRCWLLKSEPGVHTYQIHEGRSGTGAGVSSDLPC